VIDHLRKQLEEQQYECADKMSAEKRILTEELAKAKSAHENEVKKLKKENEEKLSDLSKEIAGVRKAYDQAINKLREEIHELQAEIQRYKVKMARADPPIPPDGDDDDDEEGDDNGNDDQGNWDDWGDWGEDDKTPDYGDPDGGDDDGNDGDGDDGDDDDNEANAQMPSDSNAMLLKFMEVLAKTIKAPSDNEPKAKEADSIKIPQLPTAAQFKSWKNSIRSSVSSASNDPEAAFKWIMEVEKSTVSYNDLSECPKKFTTLDAKLSSALTQICKGDLGRRITLKTEEEAKAESLI